jgi:hypothetical protein
MKRGEECDIEPLIMKPNKFTATELECRFSSIKNTIGRLTETTNGRLTEIVAYCRAEEEPGYITKFWLSYPKGMLRIEWEDR